MCIVLSDPLERSGKYNRRSSDKANLKSDENEKVSDNDEDPKLTSKGIGQDSQSLTDNGDSDDRDSDGKLRAFGNVSDDLVC